MRNEGSGTPAGQAVPTRYPQLSENHVQKLRVRLTLLYSPLLSMEPMLVLPSLIVIGCGQKDNEPTVTPTETGITDARHSIQYTRA